MSIKITLALLLISVLRNRDVKVNAQPVCSPVGTNNETEQTAVRDHRFYLNIEYPAPCSGTIERWRYCFYRPTNTSQSNSRYRAVFAVYRSMGTDDGVRYEKVSSVFRISRNRDQATRSFFRCNSYNNRNARILIEAGDFVAACIYDPADSSDQVRRQLDLAGQTRSTDHSLLQMDDVSGCGDNSLPSSISSSQLSSISSRILHIYATIENPTYIPTTSPPTTTMYATERATTTVTWSTSIPDDTTTMEETPTVPDNDNSSTTSPSVATQTTPSVSESPTSETTSATTDLTTHIIATSETDSTAAPSTTSITASTDSTTNIAQTISELTTTLLYSSESTHEMPSAVFNELDTTNDTVTAIESTENDEEVINSAQNSVAADLKVTIAIVIVAALLAVTGVIVVIIIIVMCSKKRGKTAGRYSPTNRKFQSNGNEQIAPNGVENLTYGVGYHNQEALESSFRLYDDVTNSVSVNTGEGNYFELAESEFSNTYESVGAGICSKLSPAHIMSPQVQTNSWNPSAGIKGYYLENYHSSLEDSKECLTFLLQKNKQEDIYGNLEAFNAPASNEDEIYSQLQSCGTNNLPRSHIRIMGHLGSGQFGNVEKGIWQSKEVALKTLKMDSNEEAKVKFLQEAAIMAQFKHPNIVTLHGLVSDREPLMLVVELIDKGDLRDYLHSIRPDSGELPTAGLPEMLLSFSQHVALGMQYLSGKGFVHRDLAARNILVSKDNICKVADFGMSRDLADETYYVSHGGMIPVKWTAPEAIHYKKYSTASDVWSYGCLLYEIWSLGRKPFEGITNIEVIKIIDTDKRLCPPPGCPRIIYELMIKCWAPTSGSRPRFREITITLSGNPQDVLWIPQEALRSHKLAGVLSSPLDVGESMYIDLQNKYCSDNIYE